MSRLKSRRAARAAAGNALYTDRKALILEAAGKVFLRKGFQATKLSDIAEEASMDRASLYYYVGSKQDLFESIFTSSIQGNIQNARNVEQEAITPIEKIEKLIVILMESFQEKYPFFYVFVQEDLKKIAQLEDPKNEKWLKKGKELSKEYFEIFERIIQEGKQSGEVVTDLPPNLLAHSLIGMMTSSANWFEPTGALSAKAIGQAMAKMVIEGLRNTRNG